MGAVYRAEPLSGGAAIALKLVKLDGTSDGRALRRFEREVESGRRIDSSFVARTLDSGKLGDNLGWLAMEFAEGQSLTDLIQAPLELPAARALLSQLYTALSSAHAQGIVHRDLKPENVRVAGGAADPALKVLDFGIAKEFGVGSFSGTTPGLGTPVWTAPEQTRAGYQPVPSADVWALGLLTFFVLSGKIYWRHATEHASLADLAMELTQSEIVPASTRVAELGAAGSMPAGFDAWFGRAVHRDPAARFANATDAWVALEPLLLGLGARGEAAHSDASQRVSVAPGVFLSAVILSCVAVGLAIYWLLRSMHI